MASNRLTNEQIQRISRALSDPTRYEMLRRIYAQGGCKTDTQNDPPTEPLTCGAALANLPISAATGSHHLRELEDAGLVHVAKEGRYKILTPRRDVWDAYLSQLNTI